ncbi:MAG TPA: hypothetical protein DEQ47_08595 [Solibacterales bacterium]|jgi:hypothetical protein|nr:hypothetical protein [Bryobacterales bacterium]
MARSSTSFQKRQKELARQDKQRAKAEKMQQRKVQKEHGEPESDFATVEDIVGELEPLNP